jgi:pimeloyl-ACP methyl ester carboxylesterase
MESEAALQFAMHAEVEGRLLTRRSFKPYFKHLASMDVSVFVGMLDKVRHHTVEDRLHEISAPTLIVAGQNDTFTPAWLSRRMVRLIPDSELLMVPLGSHVAPLEQPELIELRLTRFLEDRLRADKPRPRRRKAARRTAGTQKPRRRAAGGPKA